MTSSVPNNDLMPAQSKLEWVTPKISLMEAEDTDGSTKTDRGNESCGDTPCFGPS
jgi:hypothetical protein